MKDKAGAANVPRSPTLSIFRHVRAEWLDVPGPQLEQVLRSKQVDVSAFGYWQTTFGGVARKKGVLRAIFNDTDDALGAIAGGFVVLSREFVKEHPEASKIFVEQSARARHGRLDVLLRWLDETKPDLVVLEDLRTPDAKFSARCMSSATDWNCSPQRSLFRHEPADRKR